MVYETGDVSLVKNADYGTLIAEQAQSAGPRIYEIIDALYEARRYIDMNVNKSFAFEWLLLIMGG